MVEVFGLQPVGEAAGLPVTAGSEWWIVLAEAVAHPLGLGVTDERKLHGSRG